MTPEEYLAEIEIRKTKVGENSHNLDLIHPENIKIRSARRHHTSSSSLSEQSATYTINSVSPTLINNDDLVTVSFTSSNPNLYDWIGAYSPPDVDITQTVPVKFGCCIGTCLSATPLNNYLTTGTGSLSFNMTNLRAGIKFYYFVNGTATPVMVASSTQIVQFTNINEPSKNRIVPTGDPNIYTLLWSSAEATTPYITWGTSSGNYLYTAYGKTDQIQQSEMCGPPANTTGWRDLGIINKANITGILDKGLSNLDIYYRFGDQYYNTLSPEYKFHIPPKKGTQPPNRPTKVALLADLGVASQDDASDTYVWDEGCPPAINTTMSISYHIQQGEIDAVIHTGDISYANGFMATWDFYLDMIAPMAGGSLYLTTVGNHESDYPNSASLYPQQTASGGECGVCNFRLLPMPTPATTNEPWWSYDIGIIHFIGMSTEHNYTIGSKQYEWLSNDLATINRSVTPWVLFTGHRSMYVDSEYCCENYDDFECYSCLDGTDIAVMQQLQTNIEPLLYKYEVNLAFAGHFHNLERQAAVYQGNVIQNSSPRTLASGQRVAYQNNPHGTVWMLIGSAGNGPSISNINYTWSERYWNNVFGYAIVTAVNATVLQWDLIESKTNKIIDTMILTQDFTDWSLDSGSSSSDNGLSTSAIIGIVFGVVIGVSLLLYIGFVMLPKYYLLNTNSPNNTTNGSLYGTEMNSSGERVTSGSLKGKSMASQADIELH